MRIRKFLTILLTIAMVVSLLPATAFAANNTATTMRLAKTQGAVTVTNSTGKKVTQTGNMKLYNGYKVKTGAKSYAWISLDDTKVAKLDANSVMEVQKTGKNLTLYLSSGNLFFNVKDPLKSGETFSIKTSTMTTGIRGTSGCVRVISPRVTEIHLLTGEVLVYAEHPALGLYKTATLHAGQKATSLIDWEAIAASGQMVDILIEQLENHEICGICSEEIANDPELLERIEREAPHLLPQIAAAEAEKRIEAAEEAAEEKQEAIDEAVAKQVFPEEVDPYFEETTSSGGGGGSSAVTPSSVVEVATWGELAKAVSDYNDGVGTTEIRLTEDIDGSNETETLEPIENQGALTLNLGTNELKLNGSLINEGNLTITNTEGYLTLADAAAEEGPSVVQNFGDLTLNDGTIVMNDGMSVTGVLNTGVFTMKGGAIRTGSVTTEKGVSTFTEMKEISGTGIENSGVVAIEGGLIEAYTAIFENSVPSEDKYNVTITGGTIKGFSSEQVSGAALELNGRALIAGGTLSGGVNVYVGEDGSAELDMTAGTVTAAGSERGIFVIGGTVNLTGGTITADTGLIENASPIGLTVEGGTVVLDGTNITANAGTAVSLSGGTTTFQSGTITAETGATAVQTRSDTYYDNSIKATIRAKAENAVFVRPNGGLPAGYQTALINNYYVLTETGGITTWAQFVMAVDEFNAGTQAQTIRLGAEIIPPATGAATLAAIGATNPSLLTIDLNNYALTLPQTMMNEGNLMLTGGTLSADYTTVSTLIQNNGGTFELANARMNLSMNQTGIANAAGTVNMTSGTIQLNSVPSYGIVSDNGAVNLNGGEIILVGCGSSSVNYGIRGTNTDITINGGTVRESTDADYSINYAVYADGGTLNLTDGAINVEYGQAVYVSSVNILTLGDTVVKGKESEDLLVTANDVETGFTSSASDDGYYKLEKYQTVATWAAFVDEIADFNDNREAKMIQLTANINPTEEEFAAAATLEAIGNATADTLTIDLSTYRLGLPQTLVTGGSDLIITGTPVGVLTTGQEWAASGSTTLIENNDELTLQGGTMTVPDGVTGVYNSDSFVLYSENGGFIGITGGVGVENRGTVSLEMGSISVASTENNNGVGVLNNGTVNMKGGSQITVTEGIGIDEGSSAGAKSFNMTGGRIQAQGTAYSVGLQFTDTAVQLTGGTIEATTGTASAVIASGSNVTMDNAMVVRATVPGNVYTLENGAAYPAGWEVSDTADGSYYYMVAVTSSNILEVYDADDMVTAVETVNSYENTYTIRLMNDVSMEGAVDGEGNPVTELNINGADTTLDLNGSKLTLGSPLTNDGTLAITDSSTGGSITGDVSVLIDNGGNLTWDYGNMIVSAADGVGLENSGTAVVGNGIQNSATLISLTGSGATGIQVTGGEVTVDGMQIGTSASQSQTGILVAAGADLTVDSATIYALTGNTGIENNGTAILNGASLSANAGDTGTLVKNTGDLTVDGGSMTTNSGAAVYQTAGMFTMDSGTITTTAYNVGGLELYGGTANLNGGNIKVNNNGGGEIGVSMNNSTLNLDGTVITVNGFDATGIRGSGTMNLESGTVTAENAGAVAIELVSGGSGTSITLGDAVKIRAMTEANVLTPDDTDLGFVTEDGGDGYFYLAAAAGTPVIEVTNETEFAVAMQSANAGNDVTIQLKNGVTLSAYYQDAPYELGSDAGMLTIDLKNNDLILNGTLYNYGVMNIVGSGTVMGAHGFVGYTEDNELIHNFGTLTWKDATLDLAGGQVGIMTHNVLSMSNCQIRGQEDAAAANTIGVVYFQNTEFTYDSVNCATNVTFKVERLEV